MDMHFTKGLAFVTSKIVLLVKDLNSAQCVLFQVLVQSHLEVASLTLYPLHNAHYPIVKTAKLLLCALNVIQDLLSKMELVYKMFVIGDPIVLYVQPMEMSAFYQSQDMFSNHSLVEIVLQSLPIILAKLLDARFATLLLL